MKISTDGILGSAFNINQRRTSEKNGTDGSAAKMDKVEIASRIDSKLDVIDNDLRSIQGSLTLNQTLMEALKELYADIQSNGGKSQKIIVDAKYNDAPVLSDMINGKEVNESSVRAMMDKVSDSIKIDIAKLVKIQIETENIFASNLAGGERTEKLFKSTEVLFAEGNSGAASKISALSADVVMKLTK